MNSPLYNFGIIEGWASSQDMQPNVVQAAFAELKQQLDKTGETFKFLAAHSNTGMADVNKHPHFVSNPDADVYKPTSDSSASDDVKKEEVLNASGAPVQTLDAAQPAKKPRAKREYTEAERQAARDRMIAMRASGKCMGRKKGQKNKSKDAGSVLPDDDFDLEDELGLDDAPPRADSSPDRLIADHNEYAGARRNGEPLTDADWPDIRHRYGPRGQSIPTIALDYGVSQDAMDTFIRGKQFDEASAAKKEQTPGE